MESNTMYADQTAARESSLIYVYNVYNKGNLRTDERAGDKSRDWRGLRFSTIR